MKKLLKLWRENRILMILGIILVVCLISIIIVVMTYFVGSKKSVYGNRFDNMKVHIKQKEQDSYVKALEENSNVGKTRIRVTGKTIYVSVTFKDGVNLDDAKKIIEDSLDKFSEDVKETYDINFTIVKNNVFNTIMGARNASGNGLSWNNNNPGAETKE